MAIGFSRKRKKKYHAWRPFYNCLHFVYSVLLMNSRWKIHALCTCKTRRRGRWIIEFTRMAFSRLFTVALSRFTRTNCHVFILKYFCKFKKYTVKINTRASPNLRVTATFRMTNRIHIPLFLSYLYYTSSTR